MAGACAGGGMSAQVAGSGKCFAHLRHEHVPAPSPSRAHAQTPCSFAPPLPATIHTPHPCHAGKMLAVVEYVLSGHRLKLTIPKVLARGGRSTRGRGSGPVSRRQSSWPVLTVSGPAAAAPGVFHPALLPSQAHAASVACGKYQSARTRLRPPAQAEGEAALPPALYLTSNPPRPTPSLVSHLPPPPFPLQEGASIVFAPSGIRTPQRAQPAAHGRPAVVGEPFADEALAFTREAIMQRDVEVSGLPPPWPAPA